MASKSTHLLAASSPGTSAPIRPFSEFDSGLNTSAAWTEHLELGDNSPADDDFTHRFKISRPARALYDFQGESEFRELTVKAGDTLTILDENLAEGWSLAKVLDELGLIPHSYYAFTAEFTLSNDLIDEFSHKPRREGSGDTITPDNADNNKTDGFPLIPQSTGEWFSNLPNLRRSLFRGKSFNRFSSFVTSGAEEWILNGNPQATEFVSELPEAHKHEISKDADELEYEPNGITLKGEADYHFIEAGPKWKPKVPPFNIFVHSPSKRTSSITGAYTLYTITTVFADTPSRTKDEESSSSHTEEEQNRITVYRRYSQFIFLHSALTRRLPGIALPPLPEKQYTGRFNDDFVEARRGDLQRYLNKIGQHPIARYAEVTTFFLSCESDIEWKRQVSKYSLQPAGSAFYARVYHPAFNFDVDDAAETVDRFENHVKAVDKGIQGLRSMFGKIRSARTEMSSAERLLSYNLLSLITSTPLASNSVPDVDEEGDEEGGKISSRKGLTNHDGAWCWKEDCGDCLKVTKATQRASEILQGVADLYDDHARRAMLVSHEAMKDLAHPSTIYAPIIDTHKSALSRYKEALNDLSLGEEVVSRCETVLNMTMAEFTTYHTQKLNNFENLIKNHIDSEIVFYEKVLTKFRAAREVFDPPHASLTTKGPRIPSIFERDLPNPPIISSPLPQPCDHVYDAGPMKPVSAAIQDGVGILFGGASGFGQSKLR